MEYAILEGASDIHIEPTEKSVIVRYRVDGVLKDVMTLPKNAQSGILARIKILANLKIDEHRVPQDGRFKIAQGEYKVAFRVSTLPVFDGEKIVMRVLNESAEVLTLEQLGFFKRAFGNSKAQYPPSARNDFGYRSHRLGKNHDALYDGEYSQYAQGEYLHGGRSD